MQQQQQETKNMEMIIAKIAAIPRDFSPPTKVGFAEGTALGARDGAVVFPGVA